LLLASLLLSMGALCDRLGARRLMLGGLLLFGLGAGAAAIAPSVGFLIAGQVVSGIGAAALVPASLALITHAHADPVERAHAIGVWASVSAAAVAAGPVVGGLLIGLTGWRSVFAIDVVVALGIAWLVLRSVGETPRHPGRGLDIGGQVAAVFALSTLTFGLIEAGHLGWGSPTVLAALGAAGVALAAFVLVEHRGLAPMLPLALFAARSFKVSAAVGALFSFSVYGQLFVLSLYLQEQRGLSALQAGLIFLAQPATYAIVALRSGRTARHRSARTLMVFGSVVSMLGTLVLLSVGAHTGYVLIVVAFVLSGFGGALAIPALTTAVLSGAERPQVGIAAATLNALRNTGGVLGIAVIGGMIGHGGFIDGLHLAIGTSAAALALAVAVSLMWVSTGESATADSIGDPAAAIEL
jgi:MFS transporter, DHA2 family, methylenomycin A resistance protein